MYQKYRCTFKLIFLYFELIQLLDLAFYGFKVYLFRNRANIINIKLMENTRVISQQKFKKQPKDQIQIEDLKAKIISVPCAIAILIICTIAIFLVIILNVVIDVPLFIQGINFIYNYQNQQPQNALHVIQNLVSLLCNPIPIGVILLLYYIIVNRKLLLIVHISYFLFATYVIAILKQAFQQSRPVWYDSRISNWEWFCPKDFGNPSGHSFAVILLYEPIVSDSIGYWRYRAWAFVLMLMCIIVPVSRMYLGVHSANQVLFGLSLGFSATVLYKYIYQKALYELYWQFFTGAKQKLKFVAVFLMHIAVIGIPIVFYYANVNQRPMLEKDITNLNSQCGTSLTGLQVQGQMLTACGIGSIPFGLVYGFMLLSNQVGYRKYLLGLWQYQSKLKILLKLGIYIISAGIPFLLFFLIGRFALHSYPIGQFLFLSAAITAGGLGLSFLAPIITSKLKIMKLLPGKAEQYQNQIQHLN